MKRRILVHSGDELVPFESLTQEEKDFVVRTVFTRAADTIMGAQGYVRETETQMEKST